MSVGNIQFLYIRTDVIIKSFEIVTALELFVSSYAVIMKEYYLSTKRQNCMDELLYSNRDDLYAQIITKLHSYTVLK